MPPDPTGSPARHAPNSWNRPSTFWDPLCRLSSAQCARRLDIFLDKVSLDASTPTRHLLDPNFSGVFDKQQRELREARSAEICAEVRTSTTRRRVIP